MSNNALEACLVEAIQSGTPDERLFAMIPEGSPGYKYGLLAKLKNDLDGKQPSVSDTIMKQLSATPTTQESPERGAKVISVPRQPRSMDLTGDIVNIIISDLHVPLHRDDLIRYLSEKYEGGRLVIGGDLLDNAAQSKFPVMNCHLNQTFAQYYSSSDCIEILVELLQSISKYWKEIIIVRGNHDFRHAKLLAANAKGDADKFDYELVTALSKIPNVIVPNMVGPDYYSVKIGDMWVGHWGLHGKLLLGVRKVVDQCMNRVAVASHGPCSTVVQGHTHQLGSFHRYNGKWAIESGAMCLTPEYVWQSAGAGGEPTLGYVHILQRDGKVVREESHGTVAFDDKWYINYMDYAPYNGCSIDDWLQSRMDALEAVKRHL